MPSNAKTGVVSVGVLISAVIAVLAAFGVVHWTAAQTTLVTTELGALGAFAAALIAHFWPGTKKEPVAVAATFTAALTATIALGTGFAWWHPTAAQTSALMSLVTAVIGVGSALIARSTTTAGTQPEAARGQVALPAAAAKQP
jgi:uncharacterized membrane protein YeaQ/YmgE (transglycosylase-associated protein family)